MIYAKEKCLYGHYLEGIFPIVDETAKIYNRGVFVKEIKGIFSYAVNLEEGLNRDRDIIEYSDIFHSIRDIWTNVSNLSLVKKLLELYLKPYKDKRDYIESWGSITSNHSKIWAEALMQIVGKGACLSNNDISAREAETLGFKPLVGISWDVAAILKDGGIQEDIDVLSEGYEFEWVEKLSSKEETILSRIQELAQIAGFVDKPSTIRIFSKYHMDENVRGCYHHKKREIYLKQELLHGEDIEEILSVYLHECIHHETGADDLDRNFADHVLTKLSSMVMNYTSQIGVEKILEVTSRGILLPDDFKLSAKELIGIITTLKNELIITAGNITIRHRLKESFEKPSIYKRKIGTQEGKFTLNLPREIKEKIEGKILCTVNC